MNDVILATLVRLQGSVPAPAEVSPEALSIGRLILDAGPVVKAVMLILLLMGTASLFVFGAKLVRISRAKAKNARFLDAFWSESEGPGWTTERLEALYADLGRHEGAPAAALFRSGYVELARVMGAPPASGVGDLGNVERALRRASVSELTGLEAWLPVLATTGSTAPFIGLFGTVWGIMDSFIGIAANKSAGLDVVAPGIAEALVATAIGLVAAIPAVAFYNYLVRRVQVLEADLEAFTGDLLNVVRRHFLRG
ncbi:MAG: MotA/TolQ/ExbB proton channel family protein [Myxococcota bacterium]